MARGAACRPSGKVSVVFDRDKDREGAYDFLESSHVDATALTESMCNATAERARSEEVVYLVVDGTSLTLTDEAEAKGFGPIGSPNRPARGLKVMNALAVTMDGTPLGLIDQQFWVRAETQAMTPYERTQRNQRRPFEEKEGYRFVDGVRNAARRLTAVSVLPWVIVDREGDNGDILTWLASATWAFTIRAKRGRRLADRSVFNNVRESVGAERSLGTHCVKIVRNGNRAARTATVEVRAKEVTVLLPAHGDTPTRRLTMHAVYVTEKGAGARREDALDWLLYTNVPVETEEDARKVINSYRARWRVEEFHRTWKQGQCNVEDAQLRSVDAVVKWATLLSAVAMRIGRLKYISRRAPNTPAAVELEPVEIEALGLAQRARDRDRGKRPRLPRTESIMTIGEATKSIAQLGGWMGEKRSGLPGSVSIARGLDRLAIYTQGYLDAQWEAEEKSRRT